MSNDSITQAYRSITDGEIKVVVLDLDGTLLHCNSFTRFVAFALRAIPRARLGVALAAAARKLRFTSHHHAKEIIVKKVAPYFDDATCSKFLDSLMPELNEDVLRLCDGAQRSVLATAAPALYAVPLGKRLGFDDVVATLPGCPENKGEEKLRSLRAIGVTPGRGILFATDHRDDLPTLRANAEGTNLLINS